MWKLVGLFCGCFLSVHGTGEVCVAETSRTISLGYLLLLKTGEQCHISKFGKNQKLEKKFVCQSRKFSQNNPSGSQILVKDSKKLVQRVLLFLSKHK